MQHHAAAASTPGTSMASAASEGGDGVPSNAPQAGGNAGGDGGDGSGLPPFRLMKGHKSCVYNCRFTSKGEYLFTCGHDRTVKLWNPFRAQDASPGEATLLHSYCGPNNAAVMDVCVKSDNSQFVCAGEDKRLFLWDIENERVVRSFNFHRRRVNSVNFNEENSILFSAGADRVVCAWDLRSRGNQPIQILNEATDAVTKVLQCPKAPEILTASVDGRTRLYDLRRGCLQADNFNAPVVNCEVSNDGNCILVNCMGQPTDTTKGRDGSLRVTLKTTGVQLNTYTGLRNCEFLLRGSFSSDDSQVISGSEDGSVYFWDLVEGTVSHHLTAERTHNGPVTSVVCHKKHPVFITTSFDGTVKLWAKPATHFNVHTMSTRDDSFDAGPRAWGPSKLHGFQGTALDPEHGNRPGGKDGEDVYKRKSGALPPPNLGPNLNDSHYDEVVENEEREWKKRARRFVEEEKQNQRERERARW